MHLCNTYADISCVECYGNPFTHELVKNMVKMLKPYIQNVPGGMCQTSGECSLR